jgi:transcriptional regulator with XRE-family HTH domain
MNTLRSRRLELGLTQTKLAILTGTLTQGMVADFESERRKPWPKARVALSESLGCSEAELFPEADSGK